MKNKDMGRGNWMALVYVGATSSQDYLAHHGILGQKWGVRRFQNPDGSLTPEGRERYGQPKDLKKVWQQANRKYNTIGSLDYIGKAVPAVTGAAGFVGGALLSKSKIGAEVGGVVGGLIGTPAINLLSNIAAKKREKLMKETNPMKLNALRIQEGTEFKRTSLKETESENERLYVALSKAKFDIDYYSNTWPKFLRQFSGSDAKVYQNTYRVAGEIIAPSYDKRKQVADALIQADRKLKIELGRQYALNQLRLATGVNKANTIREFEKTVGPEARKKYNQIVNSIVNDKKYSLIDDASFRQFTASIPKSGKLMDAYVQELRKEGYTAVFDDNANTMAPFIVFDSSMLKQIGSKELKN